MAERIQLKIVPHQKTLYRVCWSNNGKSGEKQFQIQKDATNFAYNLQTYNLEEIRVFRVREEEIPETVWK